MLEAHVLIFFSGQHALDPARELLPAAIMGMARSKTAAVDRAEISETDILKI